MDWSLLLSQVLAQIGTVTAVIAILGVVGKIAVEKFFQSGLEVLKADLKHGNDLELAEVRQSFQKDLLAEKARADQQRELFHQTLQDETTTQERIRSQIVFWANPILNAVRSLESRLSNILEDSGYEALDGASPQRNPNWSASYEYFLNSTVYLFAQYFCWTRMLELEFSFELFQSNTIKDRFFESMANVSRALGDYPRPYKGTDPDVQVFRLQQQAIGECLNSQRGTERKCLGYAAFLSKLPKSQTAQLIAPVKRLLDGIKPGEKRWERLIDVRSAVCSLRAECEAVLKLNRLVD